LNRTTEKPKDNRGYKNKEAFVRPNARQRANKRRQTKANTSFRNTSNAFEVLESETDSEDNNRERETPRESQTTTTPGTKEPISNPSINIPQT